MPMIFAMIGAMNRMRFSSDAPQQKILGCVTDTFGAISLGAALLTFETACYSSMSRDSFDEPLLGQVRSEKKLRQNPRQIPDFRFWRLGFFWDF